MLFCVSYVLFFILVAIIGGSAYGGSLGEFTLSMLSFGPALICFTYSFSQVFTDVNTAFRCQAPFYLLIGLVVPGIITGLSLLGSAGVSGWIFFVFYLIDPFFSLFAAQYSIVITAVDPLANGIHLFGTNSGIYVNGWNAMLA